MAATRLSIHRVTKVTSNTQYFNKGATDAFVVRTITIVDNEGRETEIELYSDLEISFDITGQNTTAVA